MEAGSGAVSLRFGMRRPSDQTLNIPQSSGDKYCSSLSLLKCSTNDAVIKLELTRNSTLVSKTNESRLSSAPALIDICKHYRESFTNLLMAPLRDTTVAQFQK